VLEEIPVLEEQEELEAVDLLVVSVVPERQDLLAELILQEVL